MSVALALLVNAVEESLGDVAELVDAAFVERAINEGQARYEPDILKPMSVAVTVAADATSYALPTDFVEIDTVIPDDDTSGYWPKQTRRHGTTLYFYAPAPNDFTGTLLYFAHYPAITDDAPCELPQVAADGLVAYALYKVWKRIASNRTDYRKYSTLVNNQTDIQDLRDLAQSYLDDYFEARDAVALVRDIEPHFS